MTEWTDVRLQRLDIYRGDEQLRSDIRAALDTISAQFRRAETAEAKIAEANERLRLCEVPDGWEAWRIKAEAEVARLRRERDAALVHGPEDMVRALEEAQAEVERLRIALLLSAAAEARIRARWPHIEVPTKGSAGLLGRQVVIDPGSPTCLRCSIEDEIRGPEHRKHPSGDYCVWCRAQWPCEEAEVTP